MTTPETPGAQAPAVPVDKIRTALLYYRIMAWTTGIWLIALCYEIVSHLVFHHEIRWIEVVHGWVYFAYVLAAFNLAVKVRYRGIIKNDHWLHHRAAALNLRRLITLGLNHTGTTWALA